MKIKIDKALHEKLARVAEQKGYASADEYILHLLETAAAGADEAADETAIRQRLKGLGYIE